MPKRYVGTWKATVLMYVQGVVETLENELPRLWGHGDTQIESSYPGHNGLL